MTKPENALYRCEQIHACEQQAILLHQLDENKLMSRAGSEAFVYFKKIYPKIRHIAVFCGSGNNAGDGFVFARLAYEQGLLVTVYQCKAITELPPTAQYAALMAMSAGVECLPIEEPIDGDVELIVDALIGTGLKGIVKGVMVSAINQINASSVPVLSLDVPSGLNADTGHVANFCVRATTTLTFVGLKTGLYTADGPDHCGDIYLCPLQLEPCIAQELATANLLSIETINLPVPERKKNSHKGQYGHVLVIGGDFGMPGSIYLAGKAAMRSGAGAVSIATRQEHARASYTLFPEAMVWGVDTAADLQPLLAQASVCVIGPGLGNSEWAVRLFLAAITSQLPMVIDASALRLLAKYPQMDDNWILTPHPGEAAALLSCSAKIIQKDRYLAAEKIQNQYGGIVVLKGAGSIIHTPENTFVCSRGSPAMASAGMGDVLSGIIAGLCAQGFSLSNAAQCGVYAHALAGEQVAKNFGGAGLLASDLFDVLPNILN